MKYKSSKEGKIEVKQDYSKRIIFSPNEFMQPGHLLQVVTISPDTKQRLHVHLKQTEVYSVTEGEALIHIGGNEFLAKSGDAFICEPGDKHFLWNKSSKEFRLVVFKINKDENSDDTEWVENP